jgi:hypothetical protein
MTATTTTTIVPCEILETEVSKREAIASAFARYKGASLFAFTSETEPALTGGKKCPFKGKVLKRTHATGICGASYLNMVRNALVKQGVENPTVETKPRKWGTISPCKNFVDHVGKDGVAKEYLRINVRNVHSSELVWADTGLPIEGEDLTELKTWLKPSTKSSTQRDVDPENEVIMRDYNLENITSMKYGGEVF